MHLRLLISLLLVFCDVHSNPIDRDESTTEWTTTIADELDTTVIPDETTESTTLSSEEDRSLQSPSQTVEIRLHPQLIAAEQLKSTTEAAAPTTTASSSEEDNKQDTETSDGNQFQQQHGILASLSGRFRMKDSIGAALRRAITSSPVVHKLQHFPARTRHAPAKAGEITPRKISFGLPANLPAAPVRLAFNRHEKPARGGETPAGTRAESDHEWLYGLRVSKRPIDTFRIPSTERWLVLGARTTTTAAATTTSTATTTDEPTSTTTTPTSESTTSTPALSGVTPEMNYATPEIDHATPELVHGQPERDYGTPEVNYATPETNYATPEVHYATPEVNYATPEVQYGRPEAEFVNRESPHGHSSESTTQAYHEAATNEEIKEFPPASVQTKAIGPVIPFTITENPIDPIKELENPPLDGQSPVNQSLESSPVDDDEDYEEAKGEFMGDLDDSEPDPDAHKYLVEEKTPDGYIVGEFGVISRSSGSLRGVRYTAHGSINPQLIQDALRTFLSLK